MASEARSLLPERANRETTMPASSLRAVLVDIDGTLVDSNDAHARTWIRVLARQGHAFPHEAVRPLIGKGGDKLVAELLGPAAERADSTALADERSALFASTELYQLKPTGVRDRRVVAPGRPRRLDRPGRRFGRRSRVQA
jgi:phosphoglycolate phosphatase-like HAD superfamily hydrolase